MQFKMIAGSLTHEGRVYNKGDVITTELPLDKMFVNSWQRLGTIVDTSAPAPTHARRRAPTPAPEPLPEDAPVQTAVAEPPVVNKGKDVTSNFPKAVDEDFLVYKKDMVYFVYDKDEPHVPLNAVGLGKLAVPKFIAKLLEK